MLREKMTDFEGNSHQNRLGSNHIVQEYDAIIVSLKEDLNNCQATQTQLRSELKTLSTETRSANENARRMFIEHQNEHCSIKEGVYDKEVVLNLEKRLNLVQTEKESIFQLWQMALKTVDTLEEELRMFHKENKSTKLYDDQVHNVRETYSEAIKVLESKLLLAKENFTKQQILWETSKERIEQLNKEKNGLSQQLENRQQEILGKEKSHQETVEFLKNEIARLISENDAINKSKVTLQDKMNEMQTLLATMIAKDNVAQSKVSEAVVLIEAAVKEKEEISKREQRTLEDKLKLESRLEKISEEYTNRLEQKVIEIKENYDRNLKKYVVEMKELKAQLREKVTLLDRVQRECRSTEEELEKIRHSSDELYQRLNSRISELEQKLKDEEIKSQTCEETFQVKYGEKNRYLENQILELQEKLSASNDKFRRTQMQGSRDVEERVREAEERTKGAVERCFNLERKLSRSIDEKETIVLELRNLQSTFDREIQRRDHERRMLENKLRDAQDDLKKVSDKDGRRSNADSLFSGQIHSEEIQKRLICSNPYDKEPLMHASLQAKFDKKTKELTRHVEVHQKLSKRWKEEAKFLTSKFQKRTKELHNRISALQKQNQDLNRDLLSCQYQLCRNNVRNEEQDGKR